MPLQSFLTLELSSLDENISLGAATEESLPKILNTFVPHEALHPFKYWTLEQRPYLNQSLNLGVSNKCMVMVTMQVDPMTCFIATATTFHMMLH